MLFQRLSFVALVLCYCSVGFVQAQNASRDGKQLFEREIALARKGEIKKLAEPAIAQKDWSRAGLKSPQKTLETFMWAIREQDEDAFKECLATTGESELPTSKDFRKLGDVVEIQSTALRSTGNPKLIELKFCWKTKDNATHTLAHRFKFVGTEWKLDLSANTYEANW